MSELDNKGLLRGVSDVARRIAEDIVNPYEGAVREADRLFRGHTPAPSRPLPPPPGPHDMGITGLPLRPLNEASAADPRMAMQTDLSGSKTGIAESTFRSYMSGIRKWWWRRRTRDRLDTMYRVGIPVRITDESICWVGRTGDITAHVRDIIGNRGVDDLLDMVDVRLYGGIEGEPEFIVPVSVWRLEALSGLVAVAQETWWLNRMADLREQAERRREHRAELERRIMDKPLYSARQREERADTRIIGNKGHRRLDV